MIQIPDWQSWCLLRYWALCWYWVVSFHNFSTISGVCFCFLTLLGSHVRPAAPDSYPMLFQWASTLLVRFERLGNFLDECKILILDTSQQKIKDLWMGLTQKPYVIWPITQWPGFCLGWIRWKSACPKPSSTLTASLLVLIFHMQPWCSLRLRFAAGILII